MNRLLGGLDPPLVPSPDDARSDLRRELLKPEYHDDNLFQRFLDWLQRHINGGAEQASTIPLLGWALIVLIVVGLLAATIAVLSRARRSVSDSRTAAAVVTDDVVSAAELRSRAEAAHAAGRYAEAVVDGFRALARGHIERGWLRDTPGQTAHEVAAELATEMPATAHDVRAGADIFDVVMYGEQPATREQAEFVLGLDASMKALR